jgi:hypothetical protein
MDAPFGLAYKHGLDMAGLVLALVAAALKQRIEA